jgi:hypothetical protein
MSGTGCRGPAGRFPPDLASCHKVGSDARRLYAASAGRSAGGHRQPTSVATGGPARAGIQGSGDGAAGCGDRRPARPREPRRLLRHRSPMRLSRRQTAQRQILRQCERLCPARRAPALLSQRRHRRDDRIVPATAGVAVTAPSRKVQGSSRRRLTNTASLPKANAKRRKAEI